MKMYIFIFTILLNIAFPNWEYQPGNFSISRIHYSGGGDWYSDPSSISNLLNYVAINTMIKVNPDENKVKIGDDDFYFSKYLYLTGHGNIKLSNEEISILRNHLLQGAFLHVDDNYGLDASFRKVVSELFPEKELIALPFDHELFHCYFDFPNGLPKIHEHDNNPPQALGIFHEKKMILLYTHESDLGDGWEDQRVHNVPKEKRLSALRMGTNIIIYALSR